MYNDYRNPRDIHLIRIDRAVGATMDCYEPDHTKRVLLKGAVCGFFLCAPAAALIADLRQPVAGTASVPAVDKLLDSMKAIGRVYLEQYPHERSRQNLQRLLDSNLSWPHLRARIITDFGNDDVVFMEGWTLARTEARLCALLVV